MLRYFETTTLILGWVFALSLVMALASFALTAWRHRGQRLAAPRLGSGIILPALVVAPLALVVAFRAAHLNLLFPVHFFADLSTLVVAALAPAAVLTVSSGLSGRLFRDIPREYAHWEAKPFVLMARAIGARPVQALRRLVLLKSLVGVWSQCLPWLFGELVIVETVFNAPGLGLDAWQLARQRDLWGLATSVGWLAALYALCVFVAACISRRLGRRLETYA